MKIDVTSASAGSGKTYFLAERTFEAITKEGVRPDAVVAITYTKKAAAELAHRLRKRLIAAGQSDAASQLRDGYVGTVHSVAQRIVTELAFESGRSPYPRVAPESHAKNTFKSASNLAREELHSPGWAETLKRLRLEEDDGSSGRGRRPPMTWRSLLSELVEKARVNRLDGDGIAGSADESVAEMMSILPAAKGDADERDKKMRAAIEDLAKRFEEQYQNLADPNGRGSGTIRKRRNAFRALAATYARGAKPAWADLRFNNFTKPDRVAAADFLEEFAQHLSHPRFHSDLEAAIRGLCDATTSTVEHYLRLKQAERLVDFGDMLADAAQVLSSEEGKAVFADRIDLLLVDEFQDTSPVQLEIISALSSVAKKTVWVGDRKQSILGFQGSDPLLMEAALGAVSDAGGSVGRLEHSYRSRPSLVSFCSELFAGALERHEFDREEVVLTSKCAVPKEVEEQPALQLWPLVHKGGGGAKAAQGVAEGVRLFLEGQSCRVRERTADPTQTPPHRLATAGDVAVLARSNDQCRAIAAALRHRGIAASVGDEGLGREPEAWIIRAGLALLADPRDALAAAELMSFCGEVGDPDAWLQERINVEAARLEAKKASGGARPGGPNLPFEGSPIVDAVRELGKLALNLSPEEAVIALVGALRLHRRLTAWDQPERRRGNLEALQAVAREYQRICEARRRACTIAGLVQHLERLAAGTSQSAGATADAVMVITYHRSKGLEWPVVVCTDLHSGTRGGLFGTRVEQTKAFDASDPLAGRQLRLVPKPYGALTAGLELPQRAAASEPGQRVYARAEAENARLLYVGMTRARDHLVLVRTGKSSDWLDELTAPDGTKLLAGLEWGTPGAHELELGQAKHRYLVEAAISCDPPDEEAAVATSRRWFDYPDSVTSRVPQALRPSEGELEAQQVASFSIVERVALGGKFSVTVSAEQMAAFGDAAHAFLACDVTGQIVEAEREERAQAFIDAQGLGGEVAANLIVALSDQFRGWLDKRFDGAPRLPEWPVQWRREDGRVVSGDIDLLLRTNAGWVIIDHKSTRTGDAKLEEALRHYAGQLVVYRDAVKAATGEDVTEMWVHLPVRGEMIRISVAD